jgi:DNA-directed RNA polymerase subunit N (RpoN/RPB10)
MIIPILCFTCGKPLADKYDYYLEQVQKLQNEKDKAPKGDTRHFDELRTGPILDSLGLKRYCCRRHLLTTVDMMDTI